MKAHFDIAVNAIPDSYQQHNCKLYTYVLLWHQGKAEDPDDSSPLQNILSILESFTNSQSDGRISLRSYGISKAHADT